MGRIVHIGPGNFFRAHQAVYTQAAGGWSVTGVSLRSSGTRDALAGQGFDYALAVRDAAGERLERVTVLDTILVAPEDPAAVVDVLADPLVSVVTITVTEKGYCLAPDGTLDPQAVAVDLAQGPQSLVAFLAHGLARRRAPVTVVSCDNLSGNGDLLGAAVFAFADLAGLTLDPARVTFPNTMVDRITPRAPADLSAHVTAAGLPPASPVVTEGFTEWVIEDRFAGPRPLWERAGATMVEDVAPFEARKLRMLNGAHSFLAYAGLNRGFDFVHQAIGDADLRVACRALMEAAGTTLTGFTAAEVEGYAKALLDRFDNPALEHALTQIAMDGSQKLPMRVIPALKLLAKRGGRVDAHVRAMAEWCRFVGTTGRAQGLDDPLADRLIAATREGDPVSALCDVIGADLPEDIIGAIRNG